MYRVIQSDCKTGWLVVTASGNAVPGTMSRRRETAQAHADALNRPEPYEPHTWTR